MSLPLNPLLTSVAFPPIAEVKSWVKGRTFPAEKPLLDLSQAVPDYAPPPSLNQYLQDQLTHGSSARYTPFNGIYPLRAALAQHHNQLYGSRLDPEDMVITAGCNQAFWLAVMAVAEPGSEVLVPLPYYFNHVMTLQMLGIRPVYIPFEESSGGQLDPQAVAAAITPRTRALVVISPNNPTGAVMRPEVMEQLADLASQAGIALILDESYVHFLPEGTDPHRLLQRPDWRETVIHLFSFSKVFGMTGYRVGALVAGERIRYEIGKIQDSMVICAPHPSQLAALFALEHLMEWAAENRRRIGSRQQAVTAAWQRPDNRFRLISQGGYFAWIRHPFTGESDGAVARRLADEHHILVLPGTVAGSGLEPYLRLAVTNVDLDDIECLAERLSQASLPH